MAGMTAIVNERAQFAAIAALRWRLFVNSLRSKGGRVEFGSRIVAASIYSLGGLGAAVGLGFSAFSFVAHNVPGLLAVLLWPVFISWQVLPVMISSFSDNIELSGLLRFPLTYRAYVLVRLLYGLMDVGTLLGTFCLTGILIGITAARPSLLPPSLLILLAFAAMNVLLSRMVFAWIERWLAQRRTRELMGGLFVVLLLSVQLITPILRHYNGRSDTSVRQVLLKIAPVQRTLPPGIAAAVIEEFAAHNYSSALSYTGFLLLYAAGIGGFLGIRLRAQYNGENLSEAGVQNIARPPRTTHTSGSRQAPLVSADSMKRGLVTGPIAAVMGKEVRYILRSGPLLITLITPVFMLLVLGSQWHGGKAYRFPVGVAYTLLTVANLLYNCFGTDGAGIQLYLAAPVSMRTIVIAKNLTHFCIFVLQIALIFSAITLVYGIPGLQIVAVTVTWILFSLPVNLAVGNLLSFKSPKRMNFEKFGRQQSSTLNVLTSMGIQFATVGGGALVLLLLRRQPSLWLAAIVFAALAVVTFCIYILLLKGIDQVALRHRETLIMELCKP